MKDNVRGFYIKVSDIYDSRITIGRVLYRLSDENAFVYLLNIERDYVFGDTDRKGTIFTCDSFYDYLDSFLFVKQLSLSVFPTEKESFILTYDHFMEGKATLACKCWDSTKLVFLFKNQDDLDHCFEVVKMVEFEDFRFITDENVKEMNIENLCR